MKRGFNGRKGMMIFLFILAVLVPLGFIVMALWNNILVPVLHISIINFWQALGIFLLCKLLFGGFPGGWRGRHSRGGEHGWWRKEMYKKWETMTPEERQQFQQNWKSRCGKWKTDVEETKNTAGAG